MKNENTKHKRGEPLIMHEYCSQRVVFENVGEGYFAYCPKCEENVPKNDTFKFFPVEKFR